FDGIHLARQQRLVRERAVLDRDDLDIEPALLGEAALDHEGKAGVALRLDHRVGPSLQRRWLRLRTGRGGATERDQRGGAECEFVVFHRSVPHFSSLSPAVSITVFHRCSSCSKNASASADGLPTGATPSWIMRSWNCGSFTATTSASLNVLRTLSGKPRG